MQRIRIALFAMLLIIGAGNTQDATRPGMFVSGRHLYDKCGHRVVLRGINAMIVYWDRAGVVTYPEIAKTGANVCRIFWKLAYPTPTVEQLDITLSNCIATGMIPMPCLWEATGKWDSLEYCVDFWTSPEVAAVLQKHKEYLLLNIANEAGNATVTDSMYRAGYANAVNRIRAAGIHVPLVIDAARWGRGEEYILNNAQYLLDADPERNLLFSWHPWDPVTYAAHRGTKQRLKAAMDSSIALGICMIIGEFSWCEIVREQHNPIEWEYLISYADSNDIGYLPWVWWCCRDTGNPHSITYDKMYGHWSSHPWGESVALTHPHGIANTAVRTPYFVYGTCDSLSAAARPARGTAAPAYPAATYLLDGRRMEPHEETGTGVRFDVRGGSVFTQTRCCGQSR